MFESICADSKDASKKVVLCLDEVQMLSVLPCGLRFVEAMNAVAGMMRESKWKDRVGFCFIGWGEFGSFALDKVTTIREIAPVIEIKDWPIDDAYTINTLMTALAISDDARAAVAKTLQFTGGQPLTTCIMLYQIRSKAELSTPPSTYLAAAEYIERDCRSVRIGMWNVMAATMRTIERSPGAAQCLRQLLAAPNAQLECDQAPAGMDVLCMRGIVRKVGSIYQIKSPFFVRWLGGMCYREE